MSRSARRNTFLNSLKEHTINAGKMFAKLPTSAVAPMPTMNNCDGDDQFDSLDMLLRCDNNATVGRLLSPDQCGFVKEYIKNMATLYCTPRADARASVSLALINRRCNILQKYANKLPIMTINVSRLLYTIEAFVFAISNDNPEQRNECLRNALEFYIATDLENNEYISNSVTVSFANANDDGSDDDAGYSNPKRSKVTCGHGGSETAPNQKFSDFVHRLRSNGYTRYIFALATKLNLNVDHVRGNNTRIVTRYLRTEYKPSTVSKPSAVGVNGKRVLVGIGYLTVVQQDENRWYVKTTKTPIVNATPPQHIGVVDYNC